MRIMTFESYTHKDRLDEILDKISKYGIKNLTAAEKKFLDSFSIGQEELVHQDLEREEMKRVYEDTYFKFEVDSVSVADGDCILIVGTMYVPDLEFEDGSNIPGVLDGVIVVYSDGTTHLNFINDDDYDILDFCNGLEHELDQFIDYIVDDVLEYMDR